MLLTGRKVLHVVLATSKFPSSAEHADWEFFTAEVFSCKANALGICLCSDYADYTTPHARCTMTCAEEMGPDFFRQASTDLRKEVSEQPRQLALYQIAHGWHSQIADVDRASSVPCVTPVYLTCAFDFSRRLLDHSSDGRSSCSAGRGLVLPVNPLTHAIVGATCQLADLTCESRT